MCGRLLTQLAVIAILVQPCVAPSARAVENTDRPIAVLYRAKQSYQTAAKALETHLREHGTECTLIELPASKDKDGREAVRQRLIDMKPAAIATGGTSATTFALAVIPDVPVVYFLVPNARDASFAADDFEHRSRVAGVTSDISPTERIEWAIATRPGLSSIAILHGKGHEATVGDLKAAADAKNLRCTTILASRDTIPEAIEALNASGCEGLVMIPDSHVYNSATVQRVLLWGVRQKKAVWSFSENLVKAGALAGQHADYEAIGRQTADIVLKIIEGADPASIGLVYPEQVGRAFNKHTAGMIGATPSDRQLGTATVRYGGE